MKVMIELLNELYDFAVTGTPYEAMRSKVEDIDLRCRAILEHCKFDPAKVKTTQLFTLSDEQRNSDAKALADRVKNDPESAVGEVVKVYCDTIQRLVRDDLLAFATDFEAGSRLKFKISFHSFAINFFSTKPDSTAEKIRAKLLEFQEQGIQIGHRRNHHIFVDCERNREFLVEYCKKTFGTEPWEIHTHQGEVWTVVVSMDYAKLLPTPEVEQPEPEGDALTGDEAASMLQAVKQAKSTLSSYHMMAEAGSGDLLLSVFRGYICDIEKLSHIHCALFQESEARHKAARTMNQETWRIGENIGYTAAVELQPKLGRLLSELESHLSAVVTKDTYFVSKFTLCDNNVGFISLLPNAMVYKEPETELEGEYDKNNAMFYVANTEANLNRIIAHLSVYLPSLSLISYEVRPRNGKFTIHGLEFSFGNPSELGNLKTVPIPSMDEG